MKIIIVYDSLYGNTKKIAQAIKNSFDSEAEVFVVNAITPKQLIECSLLIVGSPTQGFRPTKGITDFLNKISFDSLKDIDVAAFDTRLSLNTIKSSVLRFFVKLGGYAAKPIADRLVKKGANLVVPPEGFLVTAKEGPLQEGEIERAMAWAKSIAVNRK